MLHVEVNRVTGDPHRLNEAISYATTELRPVLEYQAGNLGTLLLTDPGADGMAFQSFWASSGALTDTEDAIVAGIRETARLAGGRATREHYAVIVFEHEAPLHGGQGVRVTEMNVDLPKLIHVEDAVAWYGATVVPELADTRGFRAALLYAQWDSGHLISTTVWQDPQALATSRTAATQGEAAAVSALDGASPPPRSTGSPSARHVHRYGNVPRRLGELVLAGAENRLNLRGALSAPSLPGAAQRRGHDEAGCSPAAIAVAIRYSSSVPAPAC